MIQKVQLAWLPNLPVDMFLALELGSEAAARSRLRPHGTLPRPVSDRMQVSRRVTPNEASGDIRTSRSVETRNLMGDQLACGCRDYTPDVFDVVFLKRNKVSARGTAGPEMSSTHQAQGVGDRSRTNHAWILF